MSSHHVIRENQEAAVIFLSEENCHLEILGNALEWSPLLITTVPGFKFLYERNYKIDVVIGTGVEIKQLEDTVDLYLLTRVLTVKQPSLTSFLTFLKENNHHEAYIFSAFDKKLIASLEASDINLSIVEGNLKWSFIRSGKLSKWLPKNSQLLVEGEDEILFDGQPIEKTNLAIDSDRLITLTSPQGFWVGENIGV